MESISKPGLAKTCIGGLLLNFGLLFSLHSRMEVGCAENGLFGAAYCGI
jgi:hypothetical protein